MTFDEWWKTEGFSDMHADKKWDFEQTWNAAIRNAVFACQATCGNWNVVRKHPDGSRDFNCPCGEAVSKLQTKGAPLLK